VEVRLQIDRPETGVLEGLRTFGRDPRVSGNLVRLWVDSEEAIPRIARWLVDQGVAIHALAGRRKSLEEWFIEVMGEDQRPG
jgi:hypothetical protein